MIPRPPRGVTVFTKPEAGGHFGFAGHPASFFPYATYLTPRNMGIAISQALGNIRPFVTQNLLGGRIPP